MDMVRTTLLLTCLLLVGCEGGHLNSGVGKSDKFVSLVERVQTDVQLNKGNILSLENGTEYVDFSVTGIESIDQLKTNEALASFPEYNIEARFNRTEIIKIEGNFSDEQGNIITRTITSLFGTEDQYYSESEFPLDKLLVISKFPLFEYSSQEIYISYYQNDLDFFGGEQGEDFERNGEVLSYDFEGIQFGVTYDFQNYLGTTYGSGKISAEKEGKFPTF
jgi:hypothetical protein